MATNEELFERAHEFARQKHEGQFRKGGLPYITHPEAVAQLLKDKSYDISYQITGLFHDLLEDTDATEEEILSYGSPEILEAVKRLTKQDGYVMAEYMAGIKSNPIAYAVKAADRLHNLQCAVVTDEEFKRKYVLETIDWYMDFSKEIRDAVKALAQSMKEPIAELSFIYETDDNWKI